MSSYHVNPQTGNPNICRAKKKCPYGGPASHYPTKEEARAAFESEMGLSNMAHLHGRRLSRGAKILFALERAQQSLIHHDKVAGGFFHSTPEVRARQDELILNRNQLLRRLENLPWDDSDAPQWDDSVTVDLTTEEFTDGDRLGYSNDWWGAGAEETALYLQLDRASAEWASRLSTAEIRALVEYNKDADEYAKHMAGLESKLDPRVAQYMESAMAKAPRLSQPTVAYAGISRERVAALQAEAEGQGTVTLNRIQSASANPAQVNGFMFSADWEKPDDTVAVEFKIDRAASLAGFNVHRGEMELLVPSGSYRVVESYSGLTYYWGGSDGKEKRSGRTAMRTFVVEPL